VVLGRLGGDLGIGDTIGLDGRAARAAVEGLAAELGLTPEGCAQGIVDVAVQQMVAALHVVSVERGVDPRGGVLIAFGGAGPLHACAVAEGLGMSRVTCPATAGVLAALGMVVAGERRDHVQSVLLPVTEGSGLAAATAPLIARARREVPGGRVEVAVDCRYAGQSHALTVPWDPGDPESDLAHAFHDAHARVAGGALPDAPVEAVSVRVAAITDGPAPAIHPDRSGSREVVGPTAVPMDGSTCWVATGWSAAVHPDGTVRMERS